MLSQTRLVIAIKDIDYIYSRIIKSFLCMSTISCFTLKMYIFVLDNDNDYSSQKQTLSSEIDICRYAHAKYYNLYCAAKYRLKSPSIVVRH